LKRRGLPKKELWIKIQTQFKKAFEKVINLQAEERTLGAFPGN